MPEQDDRKQANMNRDSEDYSERVFKGSEGEAPHAQYIELNDPAQYKPTEAPAEVPQAEPGGNEQS